MKETTRDAWLTSTAKSASRVGRTRLQMVGAATGIAAGDWLIKGEAAHFQGLEFAMAPGETTATTARTDVLAGIVLYSSGNAPGLEEIGDNDRLFLDMAYRF